MISDLKPYPKMKDSGVEWLGEVPEHWELQRGKNLFTKMDRPVHESNEVVTCFRDGTVTLRKKRRTQGFTESLKEIGYQGIRRGDLVIHAMDAFAGAIGVSDSDGKGSPVYAVCKPKANTNSYYHAYLIREMSRSQWILALATGIRERSTDFRFGTYARETFSSPPLPEQTAIVRYLDYMDRRIRRLIRAKRKLITLLNEQKQVIIHHAVTRGLDPSVTLKDSGVEWLGMVPEHWGVLCFSRCAVEKADYRGATPTKTDDGVFLVTAKNIRKGWIDYEASREFVSQNEYAKIMRRGLPSIGDILLTTEAPLGNVALVDREDIALAQRVIRFRMDSKLLDSSFALYAIMSPYFQHQLLQRGTGSTALGIKASKLPQLKILCPPLAEQKRILHHLDQTNSTLDTTITRAQREIDLLTEYRTRLIADVVTGKVDVREVATRLPELDPLAGVDEVEESLNEDIEELLDDGDAVEAEAVP
jgi:type I restriction enzyme, S subunit